MNKVSTLGIFLFILGVCAAGLPSIIPTVILSSIGVVIAFGGVLWQKS